MEESEKWQFCEDGICYYCERDIADKVKDGEVVTSCPLCKRSFVD